MERRKFVIGAGALATGSAAAMGTGAFDLVSARRDFTVEARGDDDGAFLGLQSGSTDGTSDYAEVDDDTLAIDFSNNHADGVNEEADSRFDDVFTVTNNGTQDVPIRLVDDDSISRWDPDLPAAYWRKEGESYDFENNDFGESPVLGPGESLTVGFIFWAGPGSDDPPGRYNETDLDKAEEQDVIGVYADASDA